MSVPAQRPVPAQSLSPHKGVSPAQGSAQDLQLWEPLPLEFARAEIPGRGWFSVPHCVLGMPPGAAGLIFVPCLFPEASVTPNVCPGHSFLFLLPFNPPCPNVSAQVTLPWLREAMTDCPGLGLDTPRSPHIHHSPPQGLFSLTLSSLLSLV